MRLNPRLDLAAGVGQNHSTLGLFGESPRSLGPALAGGDWIDADTILCVLGTVNRLVVCQRADLWAPVVLPLTAEQPAPNVWACGGGNWAATRQVGSYETYGQHRGQPLPAQLATRCGVLDASRAGDLLFRDLNGVAWALWADGTLESLGWCAWATMRDGGAVVFDNTKLWLREQGGKARACAVLETQGLNNAVRLGDWISYATDRIGRVLHRWDDPSQGYRLTMGYSPDLTLVDGRCYAAVSVGAAELPTDLRREPPITLGEDMVPLAAPAVAPHVDPFSRPIWVAPFFERGRYGDSPALLGNAIVCVDPGDVAHSAGQALPLIASPAADDPAHRDRVLAWWVSGGDLPALQQAYADASRLPERPIIAYLDSRAWPKDRPDWMDPRRTWLGVQMYRNVGEALDSFRGDMTALLDRLSRWGLPIVITAQFYDRNGTMAIRDVLDVVPLYRDVIERFNVVGLMPFADRRPGGMLTYPDLRAWCAAYAAAVPGSPDRSDYWQPTPAAEPEPTPAPTPEPPSQPTPAPPPPSAAEEPWIAPGAPGPGYVQMGSQWAYVGTWQQAKAIYDAQLAAVAAFTDRLPKP